MSLGINLTNIAPTSHFDAAIGIGEQASALLALLSDLQVDLSDQRELFYILTERLVLLMGRHPEIGNNIHLTDNEVVIIQDVINDINMNAYHLGSLINRLHQNPGYDSILNNLLIDVAYELLFEFKKIKLFTHRDDFLFFKGFKGNIMLFGVLQ